ncbi:carbonic anhydrase 4a [Engraulis encrasicolus]|uniref:carbonic anhydrase 4a n=1 Tax=Engraulis encrasicolus TaxID=184585 RepID=UPI002FD0E9C5
MQILISTFFLVFCLHLGYGADWCYQTQVTCETHCKGPENWSEASTDCGGNQQSPINIVTRKTLPDERLTPFKFTGYEHGFRAQLTNNGHSVKVNVKPDASVSGGNLDGGYKAVQFHLHWGTDGGPGSEHTIDGEQYPMELHIVHMKDKYTSLGDALKDPNGVAVLGFFYEQATATNRNYQPIVEALKSLTNKDSTNDLLHPISLHQLILNEANMTNYYRYKGSLTTPGCTESVVWTVFETPIPLSEAQLAAFSSLQFGDGKRMVGTFRPVQPLNGRMVYRSGCAAVISSVSVLLASMLVALHLSHPN